MEKQIDLMQAWKEFEEFWIKNIKELGPEDGKE